MDKRVINKLNEGETKMRRKRLNENKALNDREENNMSELKRKTSDDILDLVEVNDLLELDNGLTVNVNTGNRSSWNYSILNSDYGL